MGSLLIHRVMKYFKPALLFPLIPLAALFGCARLGQAESMSSAQIATCQRNLSLDEFRALAFEKSPLISQIDSEYAQQLAKALDARLLSNPEVQVEQVYTRMKLGGDSDPQTNASVGLPLRLSNFGSRAKVASLMERAGDVEKRAALLELSQKVALQYYSLQSLQSQVQIVRDAERRASQHVASIRQGVVKGLVSSGDQKLFDGERYRLQAQKIGLESSLASLRAEVARSLGMSCAPNAGTGPHLSPDIPTESELVRRASDSDLSESKRVDLLQALAGEQVRLAELDGFPQITPRLVYQHTNDGGDFVGVGVAFPLPVFNRNQAAITRAEAERVAAMRKREFLTGGGLQVQIQMARQAAVQLAEQSLVYEQKVVPAFHEALRSHERLYMQGTGSVMQVSQTLRVYTDAQQEALGVRMQALGARMQLSLLIGEEV